jgi:hypothetical protein
MRGPGIRLDLDVRRKWLCPVCGMERKTQGDVTAVECQCSPAAPQMRLIDSIRTPRPERKPYDPYLDAATALLLDEPAFDAESSREGDTFAEPDAVSDAQSVQEHLAPGPTDVQLDPSPDASSQPEPDTARADSDH